jgi:pyruvate,orthophosphate dikinase
MTNELGLLQALRLKGRASAEALAAASGSDLASTEAQLQDALNAELVASAGSNWKLTPAGRDRLTELVTAERKSIDTAPLEQLYEEFDDYNNDLKSVVTAWQMKAPDQPNDHTDADYDGRVVEKLVALHGRFGPWLERLSAVNPRLAIYATRFDSAIAAVQGGDHSFIARPIADSYHTVWFELHEVLIGLLGRDRAGEAAAGRAL